MRFHELIHHERGLLATRRSDVVGRDAGDRAPRRHVVQHHAAGRHAHAIADLDIAEDLGAGTHHHAEPILGWRSPRSLPVPPSVTPCRNEQLSPITAVSPMTMPVAWSSMTPLADPRGGVDVDLENARGEAL